MSSTRPAIGACLVLLAALAVGPARAEGPFDPDKEVFRKEFVIFEAFPREAPAGRPVRLQFRLTAGFRDPVLVVVFPDGSTQYSRPEPIAGIQFRGQNSYATNVDLDRGGGRHRVSLVADSPVGDQMVAQFLLTGLGKDGKPIDRDVDLPPEDTVYAEIDGDEHTLRLERVLFHRMNAFRKKNGLKPLPWLEGVAAAAREQMPDVAQVYEDTFDPKKGWGEVVHKVPGGATIADRVRSNLGWPLVTPKLPQQDPVQGRGTPNYISEILTGGTTSLDQKFEQSLLRKSDLRAPMLDTFTTHAAGACTWRVYERRRTVALKGGSDAGLKEKPGEKPGERPVSDLPPANPGPEPGRPRQLLAALVFIQVNDPAVEDLNERIRRTVLAEVSNAGEDEGRRVRALRRLGQHSFPEGLPILRTALGSARPAVVAAALDALFLQAPEEARAAVAPLRVRVLHAFAREEFGPVTDTLATLGSLQFDAATKREAKEAAARIRVLGARRLEAAEKAMVLGRWAEAKDAYDGIVRAFKGLYAAEEAEDGLRLLLSNPAAKEALGGSK